MPFFVPYAARRLHEPDCEPRYVTSTWWPRSVRRERPEVVRDALDHAARSRDGRRASSCSPAAVALPIDAPGHDGRLVQHPRTGGRGQERRAASAPTMHKMAMSRSRGLSNVERRAPPVGPVRAEPYPLPPEYPPARDPRERPGPHARPDPSGDRGARDHPRRTRRAGRRGVGGRPSAVSTERIDLDGRCVVPGLVDAHVHFLCWAVQRTASTSSGGTRVTGCLEPSPGPGPARAAGCSATAGWRTASDGQPTAAALDGVTGERPAALWAHDRHSLWLNGAALRALGLDRDRRGAGGRRIERDATARRPASSARGPPGALPLPEPGARAPPGREAGQRRRTASASPASTTSRRTTASRLWQELTPTGG